MSILFFLILLFVYLSDEGTSKTFTCARPLIGQFVAIQLVGVEGSLSLCEVEVFSNDGMSCFQIFFLCQILTFIDYCYLYV